MTRTPEDNGGRSDQPASSSGAPASGDAGNAPASADAGPTDSTGSTGSTGSAGQTRAPARRSILLGGLGIGAAAVAGLAVGRVTAPDATPTPPPPTSSPTGTPEPTANVDQGIAEVVPAAGEHQAGIVRPDTPQSFNLLLIANLAVLDEAGDVREVLRNCLAAAGQEILTLTRGVETAVSPDGAAALTVTVGLGPRALAASGHPDLENVVRLPLFRGDEALDPARLGGDLLLSVCGNDPGMLEPVLRRVLAAFDALGPVRTAWSELGWRGPASEGVTRNPFGYYDGIIVPRGEEELAASVWINDGPLAGGTVCVLRRFALDVAGFAALDRERRDAIMGRQHASGAPLSGGDRMDEVNLLTKTPEGEFLTPADSHARAAHPSFTGSGLMLRRSYNFREPSGQVGHVFICFQNDVDIFRRTMLRLEEVDALMAFATANAGGAFAVLPGFTADQPLGGSLF